MIPGRMRSGWVPWALNGAAFLLLALGTQMIARQAAPWDPAAWSAPWSGDVILTLANGENKEYKVPDSFRFVVEGKPASVHELKQGMKVTATKIIEEPQTEISTETKVTGKAPK